MEAVNDKVDRKPNIVLIVTDQQRYDTLGCNGSKIARTPNLDDLAASACRFEHPYITSTACIPSRACIQTGRYTHQHGVRYTENMIDSTPGLPPWERTFMELLQVAGYETGASGNIHMLPPKGFHETHLSNGKGYRWLTPYGSKLGPAQLGDEYAGWLEARKPGAYASIYEQRRKPEYRDTRGTVVNVLPTEDYVDTWITENAIDFVTRERERPFFLWYGLLNPHGPCDPPREYAELYPVEMISDELVADIAPEQKEMVRRLIAFYFGLCTYVDDMVGRLFTALREKGLWENTLIIFTSDHGDRLGEAGKFGKGDFYESIIKVPLIIKPPGVKPARSVASGLVELIDLAPTILGYAGLPVPSVMQGSSLRPVIEGKEEGKEAILCENTNNTQTDHGKCLRTSRFKYVQWSPGGRTQLFDLAVDSEERHNLVDDPAYKDVLIEMQQHLISHMLTSEKPVRSF